MTRTPKVVTFDLWQTLIKSNPADKPARARAIQKIFAPDMPADEVEQLMRAADRASDQESEEMLVDLGAEDRLKRALETIAPNTPTEGFEWEMKLASFQELLIASFLENPPQLISEGTAEALKELKEETGCQLVVISNTGYNTGAQMRTALEGLGILPLFDKLLFSNETGQPKPHPGMFLEAIGDNNPKDCLHIGDNPRADVEGAGAVGMQTALVTKSYTAHDVIIEFTRIARRNSKAN